MTGEVRIERQGKVGRITLTRPEALHALTLGMCEAMIAALLAWEGDPDIGAVMIDHEGGRGFCAGGDIRALYDSLHGDGFAAERFFYVEYQLDHLIFTYAKPVVAFMDGIVMGGGAGVALAASHRINTENTLFAMPECGIGLFPDVGAGWHLSRLLGKAGLWLALTGSRIKGAPHATHYIDAAALPLVKQEIAANPKQLLDVLLSPQYHLSDSSMGSSPKESVRIDRLFGGGSVDEILNDLRADASDWAKSQAAAIERKCPMMLEVAYRELARGARFTNFADELAMEYALAVRTIHRPDFMEGVRAVVIDKDNNPRWSPATLADVTDAMVDAMFEPLPPEKTWVPLR